MKFNNYQKILLAWAVLLGLGYLLSWPFIGNAFALLAIWTLVSATALGLQVYLGYPRDTKAALIQGVWILTVFLGSILTYLELRAGVFLGISGMVSGWFFLCSSAMLLTAIIYRFNLSYIILCILYAVVGVILAFGGFGLQNVIYISAVGFFGLCLLDVFLESTKLREDLAD